MNLFFKMQDPDTRPHKKDAHVQQFQEGMRITNTSRRDAYPQLLPAVMQIRINFVKGSGK